MSPAEEHFTRGFAEGMDAGQDALRQGVWQPMTPLRVGLLFSERLWLQGYEAGWDEAKQEHEGQVAVG